jgi:NADPH2:quinone reductase
MFEVPDDIPLPEAAALYFPFHLAWLGLFDRADLSAGDSVLIHAAAGGSGSAAVQLAKDAGARVFATAGSDEKVRVCRDLGADVAINYTTDDFAEIVMAETDNRGVDVVFDNVGASVFEASLKVTAYNGRYLMMGFASDKSKVDEPYVVPRGIAAGNVKLCGVLLSYADPGVATFVKQAMGFNFVGREVGDTIMAGILERVRSGAVKPLIGSVVRFDAVPQAIDDLANRRTTGRVIVQLGA